MAFCRVEPMLCTDAVAKRRFFPHPAELVRGYGNNAGLGRGCRPDAVDFGDIIQVRDRGAAPMR